MFVLWDADGNKIKDEYPTEECKDLLSHSSLLDFELQWVVEKVQMNSGLNVNSIHQLGENHYTV
jgi:hypothetical protein